MIMKKIIIANFIKNALGKLLSKSWKTQKDNRKSKILTKKIKKSSLLIFHKVHVEKFFK